MRGTPFIRLPGRRLKAGPGAADTARSTAAAAAVVNSRDGHDGTTQRRVQAASNRGQDQNPVLKIGNDCEGTGRSRDCYAGSDLTALATVDRGLTVAQGHGQTLASELSSSGLA